jgi:alkyl sulfatase BDS1-like metallo-beta-lactamase superfamily hydrolase
MSKSLCFFFCKEDLPSLPRGITQMPLDQEAQTLVANDDRKDFDFANRGFIATRADPVIKRADGRTAFDLSSYAFLNGAAPETANPTRPVQSRRPDLPGPRLRRFHRFLYRCRHRLDRG